MNLGGYIAKLALDSRNLFGTCQLKPEEIERLAQYDTSLAEFYQEANPLDVEVYTEQWGPVRFIPYESLMENQANYKVQDYLVFASINGDPVAVNDSGVYLGTHGSDSYEFVQVASDFPEFLKAISS